jgi:hypothetical protein
VVEIDGRQHNLDFAGVYTRFDERLFHQIRHCADTGSMLDFTHNTLPHAGMNKAARLELQATVFIGKRARQTINVGVQCGQDKRYALAAQTLKSLTALPHHAIEQPDASQMRAKLRVEIDIVEQREKIVAAAKKRSTEYRTEAQPRPAVERYIDAIGSSGPGAAAEDASQRKLIEGVDHLPKEFTLPSPSRDGIRGIANQRFSHADYRAFSGDGGRRGRGG